MLNAGIAYSNVRQSGPQDSGDPLSYPASWLSAGELCIRRRGLYFIQNRVSLKVQETTAPRFDPPRSLLMVSDPSASAFSIPADNMISVKMQSTISDKPFYVLSGNVQGYYCPPTRADEQGSTFTSYRQFRGGPNWYVVIWNPSDFTTDGPTDGIRVSFTGDNYSGAFRWGTSADFDISNISSMTLDLQYIDVQSKTYYEPAVNQLTTDDSKLLGDSVNSILALLPKLKELGICDAFPV